jgi:hypothetical protein
MRDRQKNASAKMRQPELRDFWRSLRIIVQFRLARFLTFSQAGKISMSDVASAILSTLCAHRRTEENWDEENWDGGELGPTRPSKTLRPGNGRRQNTSADSLAPSRAVRSVPHSIARLSRSQNCRTGMFRPQKRRCPSTEKVVHVCHAAPSHSVIHLHPPLLFPKRPIPYAP